MNYLRVALTRQRQDQIRAAIKRRDARLAKIQSILMIKVSFGVNEMNGLRKYFRQLDH